MTVLVQLVRRAMHSLCGCLLVVSSTMAAADYPPVVPGYHLEFPRDEGSHPEFRTEWWYVTGWLEDQTGAPLGFQVTFFRTRPGFDESNPSRFAVHQVLFAHAALSDPRSGKLLRDEKSAREGFGLAQASTTALNVSIDRWELRQEGGVYHAAVDAAGFALQLELETTQPHLLQGKDGFSQKSPSESVASYYYSLPHLRTTGRIKIAQREYRVRGTAWMDHEWSDRYLDPRAQGWDWVGLNLDDGGALMVFRMREADDKTLWTGATWRNEAGRRVLQPSDIEWSGLRSWRSPRTGIQYPVEWQIRVGDRTLKLQPFMDDQENDARASTGTIYWEGAVRAHDESGKQIGRGYLELTGYGEKVRTGVGIGSMR